MVLTAECGRRHNPEEQHGQPRRSDNVTCGLDSAGSGQGVMSTAVKFADLVEPELLKRVAAECRFVSDSAIRVEMSDVQIILQTLSLQCAHVTVCGWSSF